MATGSRHDGDRAVKIREGHLQYYSSDEI
jgi:hypothetical protein